MEELVKCIFNPDDARAVVKVKLRMTGNRLRRSRGRAEGLAVASLVNEGLFPWPDRDLSFAPEPERLSVRLSLKYVVHTYRRCIVHLATALFPSIQDSYSQVYH